MFWILNASGDLGANRRTRGEAEIGYPFQTANQTAQLKSSPTQSASNPR